MPDWFLGDGGSAQEQNSDFSDKSEFLCGLCQSLLCDLVKERDRKVVRFVSGVLLPDGHRVSKSGSG